VVINKTNTLFDLALYSYHFEVADSLKYDLAEGEAGYNEDITDKLIKKYEVKDWKQAYELALEFHQGRIKQLKKHANIEIDRKTLERIRDWTAGVTVLGEEPSEEFKAN